jgi:hypothetical protein
MKTNTKTKLKLLNEGTATFTCVWPSCGGACCKESRPPISPREAAKVRANMHRFLPHMRPEAKALAERGRWLTHRIKSGFRTLAVVDRYCVFYAEGCALHKAGAAEGDKNAYKPSTCITFPLDRDAHDRWYVRQKGFADEGWDLPCLDPASSPADAKDSLREEIAFVERLEAGEERWRGDV